MEELKDKILHEAARTHKAADTAKDNRLLHVLAET